MRLMMSAMLLFVLACSVVAGPYPVGYVTSSGYVFGQDGNWWYDNIAYTRSSVWVEGYYARSACNCYYNWVPGYYKYVYAAIPVPRVVTPRDPEWKSKLLAIAAYRDKAELGNRRAALEHQLFTDSVRALGLEGNFRIQGYGQGVLYPAAQYPVSMYGGNVQLGTYGANGQTVYGYSYRQVADAYGQTDLNALYQQSARLVQGAQGLAGDANTRFSELARLNGEYASRVAEINAKAEALVRIAQGIRPEPRTQTTTSWFSNGTWPPPQQPEGIPPPQVQGVMSGVAVVQQRCASCHSDGKNPFQAANYPRMTLDQRLGLIARATHDDPDKRMPRDQANKPVTLPAAEIKAILLGN